MGGRRGVEARKKWRPKWGGRLKRAGRPEESRDRRKKWSLKRDGRLKRGERLEGIRGQRKVEFEKRCQAETGWEAGGK